MPVPPSEFQLHLQRELEELSRLYTPLTSPTSRFFLFNHCARLKIQQQQSLVVPMGRQTSFSG